MTTGAIGYEDALIAAKLCAIDPVGLGGMSLRGGDDIRGELVSIMANGRTVRRVPSHIDDERLLGGLDLGATLSGGAAVAQRGLLAEADGGVIVIPMAERLPDAAAARIASVIDSGVVAVERDGLALRSPARFSLVMLDDGIEDDERPPAALLERVAFHLDLTDVRPFSRESGSAEPSTTSPVALDLRLRGGAASDEALHILATTALALGVDSARAPLFALRAARAAAAFDGRTTIDEDDLILAVRLVLAPRATRMPMPEEMEDDASDAPPPPPENEGNDDQERGDPGPMEDIVLAAALASLPKDVLARIADGGGRRTSVNSARGKGERRRSTQRGRPMGARAGLPRGGLRLSLIDTLRAAAPWQKLRQSDGARVKIRRDDLRVRRFETRAEATTIFAVDASGSAALTRLAEAKGAIELLLAQAYVKRAHVALIAFRGRAAELLLPPTRSLARAKRSLAELPGGGGTPLAAGLNAARELAEAARSRGRTPFLVILTDGRGNIAADGSMVRERATDDAEAAARAIGASGIAGAFVDISPRPRPEGAMLAGLMGARYLPLPRADAAAMHAAVVSVQQ